MSKFLTEARLSIGEAAREAEVSLSSCWRWVLKGVRGVRLRTVLVGGRRYVLVSDLDAFLAELNRGDSCGQEPILGSTERTVAMPVQTAPPSNRATHAGDELDQLLKRPQSPRRRASR